MLIRFFPLQKEASSSSQRMRIILGGHTVKAFVAAPKDVKVIGIVRFGMEFGLLAMTPGGDYARVNGSATQQLNNQDVEEAIHRAIHFGRGESFAVSRTVDHASMPRAAPSVLVKKHRRIVPEAWFKPG